MTMAEALGVVSGVIACLQITNTVLSVCYYYNAALQGASWELSRIQKEMEDLRTVLQALEPVANATVSSNQAQLPTLALLCTPQGPLETCLKEIGRLQEKLKPPEWTKNHGRKRTALVQSLRWPLKEAETIKILETISRIKETLQLALGTDHTLLALKIQELSLSTYNITLGTQNDVRSTYDAVLQTGKDVHATGKLALDSHRDLQREKLDRWLSAPDPSTNYLRARRSRQENTGLWFLHGAFNEWTKKAQLMWLHGKPGCGKTVLSSTVIAQVNETYISDGVAVAYFFFDFNDIEKQKSDKMIRSIVKQLYASSVKKDPKLESLFSSCNNGERQPSSDELMQVLKDLMEGFYETYVILDALDECSDTQELLANIEQIQVWQLAGLHMLLTSRRLTDIEEALEQMTDSKSRICIQNAAVDADIEVYVRHRLQTDKKLKRWQNHVIAQKDINDTLKSKADGMFRWAVCQLDALQNCLNLTTLRKALASLPKTLDETYARILHNISDDYSEYAIKILQFLAFSMRPLELGELAEIVAINPHGDPWFDHDARLPEPRDILTICTGLVVEEERHEHGDEDDDADQDEDGDEKWDENQGKRSEDHDEHQDENRDVGWVDMSENSDGYGNGDSDEDNDKDISEEDSEENSKNAQNDKITDESGDERHRNIEHEDLGEVEESIDMKPVLRTKYDFKNRNIVRFAHFSVKEYLLSERIRDKTASRYAKEASKYAIQEISAHESIAAHCLAYLHQFEEYGKVFQASDVHLNRNFINGYQLSHYAATQCLRHVKALGKDLRTTKELILTLFFTHKKALDKFNLINSIYSRESLVNVASEVGATELIRLLLENGADVNARGSHYRTALHAASCEGHHETVQLLLENGADVNAQCEGIGTALSEASLYGHSETVQLLLNGGADVNAQGGVYSTALQAASHEGHVETVRLLLNEGLDVNAQDGYYHTVLHTASHKGHVEIVQLLLNKGADVNAQSEFFYTALQAASDNGHVEIVQLLLNEGADVNAQGGYYHTALQAASYEGHVEIVQLLLKEGADVNVSGGSYHTALQAASHKGHVEIVQLLLNEGADVNVSGGEYHTALQAASYQGNVKIVQLLLNEGADVNISGGRLYTALHAAASRGHKDVTEILLSRHADVSISGQFSDDKYKGGDGTALHAASVTGEAATVKLLLKYGAEVYAMGTFGGRDMTALEVALQRGVNALWYRPDIFRRSDKEYEKVVQLLRSAQDSQRNVEPSHHPEDGA